MQALNESHLVYVWFSDFSAWTIFTMASDSETINFLHIPCWRDGNVFVVATVTRDVAVGLLRPCGSNASCELNFGTNTKRHSNCNYIWLREIGWGTCWDEEALEKEAPCNNAPVRGALKRSCHIYHLKIDSIFFLYFWPKNRRSFWIMCRWWWWWITLLPNIRKFSPIRVPEIYAWLIHLKYFYPENYQI